MTTYEILNIITAIGGGALCGYLMASKYETIIVRIIGAVGFMLSCTVIGATI
jgi:hypothetical protein